MLKPRQASLSALAALSAVCFFAAMAPASAQPRRDDRDHHFDDRGRHFDRYHHDWHHGYGGGYYAPPPVVYSPPYYAPPPVVYSPGIGVNIHIP